MPDPAGTFRLVVSLDFSASHQLRHYQGKCENMHGHNFTVSQNGYTTDSPGIADEPAEWLYHHFLFSFNDIHRDTAFSLLVLDNDEDFTGF